MYSLGQSCPCPWPLKLVTSLAVKRTWIRTGGYGRLMGEWVNWDVKKYIVGVQNFQLTLQCVLSRAIMALGFIFSIFELSLYTLQYKFIEIRLRYDPRLNKTTTTKNAICSVEPLGGSWYSSCPAFFLQLVGETLYTTFKKTSSCSCVCVRVCL